MDRKIDLLISTHAELQDQVRFGDSKATAIITFKLVMLAFLRTQVNDINDAYHNGDVVVIGLFSLFMVTFMISTIYILKVIVPRVSHHSNKRSSIFFSEIAEMKEDEYIKFVESQSAEDLSKDYANQIHALSRIMVIKYANIQKSIYYFGLSNICFWVAILRASLL
ncbi:MAG: hypothetical protein IIB41_02130 [Candidatus Marinimicrobia bacterium]|nr:hypothetical protein [Candidatus Neomarinimicrobiota bacterium]